MQQGVVRGACQGAVTSLYVSIKAGRGNNTVLITSLTLDLGLELDEKVEEEEEEEEEDEEEDTTNFSTIFDMSSLMQVVVCKIN